LDAHEFPSVKAEESFHAPKSESIVNFVVSLFEKKGETLA
jgi:hypothetical protein